MNGNYSPLVRTAEVMYRKNQMKDRENEVKFVEVFD